MPGIVRKTTDEHIGHASPTPGPFHKTAYDEGSDDVFVNDKPAVRKGDKTVCGDPAVGCSEDVYVNGILVHRKDDATGGHGSWVPNKAETGSEDVFANGA